MTADVFLYSGEPSPSDVKLRDPTASSSAAIVGAGAISSGEVLGQPDAALLVDGGSIAGGETIGAAALAAGIASAAIGSSEALGALGLAGSISPAAIASTEVLGAAAVGAAVEPAGIAGSEAFGAPLVGDAPPDEVAIAATPGQGRIGARVRWLHSSSVGPAIRHEIHGAGGVPSEEAIGRPTITAGARIRSVREKELFELLRRAA